MDEAGSKANLSIDAASEDELTNRLAQIAAEKQAALNEERYEKQRSFETKKKRLKRDCKTKQMTKNMSSQLRTFSRL